MNQKKYLDSLYATHQESVADFAFDESVATVFEDMIERSLPGYKSVVSMIGLLAGEYVQPGTFCYDLGCSSGTTTLSIRQAVCSGSSIVAVDNSMPMLKKCVSYMAAENSNVPVHVICGDIRHISIQNASTVVLNFVLQFLMPHERLSVLKNIYSGMLPGAAVILSEKISFEDQKQQTLMTDLHHSFKKANGYSDLEISQKRSALENVLISETVAEHKRRLHEAGFTACYEWFRCFNFVSLLALK